MLKGGVSSPYEVNMKRLLIILLAVLLLAACSQGIPEVSNGQDVNKEIDLNNDKNDEAAYSNEETQEPSATQGTSEAEGIQEAEKKPETEETKETEENHATEPIAPIESALPADPGKLEPSNELSETVENEQNILKIKGLVENDIKFSLDDLKAMNDIIFEADFYSLNSYGTTGYTHFKGVKLWNLLESKAFINPEATKVIITAQDGYSMEFTLDQVKMEYMDETNPANKYPMIIAWEEKGEEYSADDGAPYKLVVGQKEPGDVNKPQWVSNIDIIIIE